jgi:hypothetical protein
MAGKTIVLCKHPHGLHLDVYDKSGTKRRATLKGNARVYGVVSTAVGGYAMTEVDTDLWNAWLEAHKDSSLVKDGIVFAAPSAKEADKVAEEHGEEVADLNPPLDPATAVPGVEAATTD